MRDPNPNSEDCWEILGIEPTDDMTEIRRAYERAADRYPEIDDLNAYRVVRMAYNVALGDARDGSWKDVGGDRDPERISIDSAGRRNFTIALGELGHPGDETDEGIQDPERAAAIPESLETLEEEANDDALDLALEFQSAFEADTIAERSREVEALLSDSRLGSALIRSKTSWEIVDSFIFENQLMKDWDLLWSELPPETWHALNRVFAWSRNRTEIQGAYADEADPLFMRLDALPSAHRPARPPQDPVRSPGPPTLSEPANDSAVEPRKRPWWILWLVLGIFIVLIGIGSA